MNSSGSSKPLATVEINRFLPEQGSLAASAQEDLFENAVIGIHMVGADGTILKANQAELELLGYGAAEYIGHPIARFHVDEAVIAELLERLERGEALRAYPARLRCKDGSIRHVLIDSNAFRVDGTFQYTRCFTTDVTELWRANESLRASAEREKRLNERFQLAADSAGIGVWDFDHANNTLVWDESMYRLYKVAPTEFAGVYESWRSCVHPEDQSRAQEEVQQAIQGLKDFDTSFRIVWPSGEVRHIKAFARAVCDADGRASRLIGLNFDITERRRAEDRMRLLESVVVHASDAVLITEAESSDEVGPPILYVNGAFCRMTGYDPEDVLGRTPRVLQGPGTDRREVDRLRAAIQKRQSVQLELLNYRKDGTEFWADLNIVPVAEPCGRCTHWIAILRDTTERKAAEHALREGEQFVRAVLDSLTAHVAVVDRSGRILAVNEAWKRFTRKSMGVNVAPLGIGLNYLEECRKAMQRGDVTAESALMGIEAVLQHELPSFECEYACPTPEGPLWALMHVTPLPDDAGAVISHTDVTERRRSAEERDRLLARLLTATEDERSRISRELHDGLGQSLTSLLLGLRVISEASDLSQARALTDGLRATVVATMDEVRRLSRGLRPRALDELGLLPAITRLLVDFESSSGIMVQRMLRDPEPLLGSAAQSALFRVTQEALQNVQRHARAGRMLVRLQPSVDHVELLIYDDGRGFDLQEVRHGAGLGLIDMRERVSQAKGTLEIHSRLGAGTTLRVRLPVEESPDDSPGDR